MRLTGTGWNPARRTLALVIAAPLVLAGILAVGGASPAAADTGNYPYWNMPCEHSPYATSGPANYCANYDWGPKHTQKYNDPSEISPYGYAYRNCTDYVAWRLASLGVPTSIYKGHGNGSGWASVSGLTTNTTPAVGAVAVQTSGTFGHVAFITGVSGSTITIAEYNYGENGTYDTRSGTLSGLGFNKVTHFEKYESGGGQGSGEEVVPVTTSDGHVQIFYDSNGTLGENWYSPGNGSSGGGTLNPGIQVEGNPTLVPRSGQSVIDAFIRGTNGQIFETWYNWGNGVWGGWIPIGGNTFTGDPEAVATSDGHDQVFADANGTLEESWFSPGNGAVGGWATPGGIQVEGNPTLVPRSGQSVIDAFIRGTNGQIFETWYNWGNGVWGGWIPIGGNTFTGDPEAVATSDGHDQVFADANGTLEENWFSPGNGAVGGWVLV